MDFTFSQEEQKLLEEVRAFLKAEATDELRAETKALGAIYGGKEGRKFIKKFAANGWLTPSWPEEYGGLGTSSTIAFAIREEMGMAGSPMSFVAAPTWPTRSSPRGFPSPSRPRCARRGWASLTESSWRPAIGR